MSMTYFDVRFSPTHESESSLPKLPSVSVKSYDLINQ